MVPKFSPLPGRVFPKIRTVPTISLFIDICPKTKILCSYVIVNRNIIPRFDERFSNYGWDKISWLFELSLRNFSFEVLPYPFYVIHGAISSNSMVQFSQFIRLTLGLSIKRDTR